MRAVTPSNSVLPVLEPRISPVRCAGVTAADSHTLCCSGSHFTIHLPRRLDRWTGLPVFVDELNWGSLRPSLRERAKPFLKWAGGKSLALADLREYIPDPGTKGTYYEPFLGGGAVFFGLRPRLAVLSDLNEGLMATYSAVKNHIDETLEALSRLPPRPSESEFRELRKRFNRLLLRITELDRSDRVRCAALFIWLNHTCYNGLYRVNRKGEFNVPFGFYEKPSIFNEAALRAASRCLNKARARLETGDFESALAQAGQGDVAYLDPPYEPMSTTSSFTTYTPGGFTQDDQARLSRVVHSLVERGCRVVLSNSPSDKIKQLYEGFQFETVPMPRAINCNGERRSAVDELVIIA